MGFGSANPEQGYAQGVIIVSTQETPKETLPQGPSLTNYANFDDNLVFYLLLLKLSKTPEGQKDVLKLLNTIALSGGKAIVAACGVARGVDNHIGEYGSLRLTSLYLERFGFITTRQAQSFALELAAITAADIAQDVEQDLSKALGGIFGGLAKMAGSLLGPAGIAGFL